MRDQRGYSRPSLPQRNANQPVDMAVPGTGGTTRPEGDPLLDNRSAAHYANTWPGSAVPVPVASSPDAVVGGDGGRHDR
jgi:hypothetical protein